MRAVCCTYCSLCTSPSSRPLGPGLTILAELDISNIFRWSAHPDDQAVIFPDARVNHFFNIVKG